MGLSNKREYSGITAKRAAARIQDIETVSEIGNNVGPSLDLARFRISECQKHDARLRLHSLDEALTAKLFVVQACIWL